MRPRTARRAVAPAVPPAALLARVRVVLAALAGVVVVVPLALAAQQDEQRKGPDPIEIERDSIPLEIPEVARDQVICFTLYTVHRGVLKLSAQLYPLRAGEERRVELEVAENGGWKRIAEAPVDAEGWLATFRVEGWNATKTRRLRVTHAGGAHYEATVRRDPIDRDEIVVAAFTGNSNRVRGPRADIVRNVLAQDPDLLFFSGDQSYDHTRHTAAWLLFGRQFGELLRDRPTVTIPDDHDVGQANLWGEGGKVSKLGGGADGGYRMPVDYVNLVERAQTKHLPDPYDPTPIARGITVYYTSLAVGGIDFAIIEDRKWKTGPSGILPQQGPRPDHIDDPSYDRQSIDVPEARLLGERQLRFLRAFGDDWDGVEMKAVLSQTIFAGGAHIHGGHEERLLADLDSNGWPQSGRARALLEIRRFFGVHIAGDQHLATVIHHGVHAWEDSIWSFCVPSIVNFYGRWWWPLEEPMRHDAASPLPFTGRFYDGFGNKLTMHAYANPTRENHNAAGYGLVRFKKSTREVRMECWPRHVDVTDPAATQFPGWPVTIRQEDNYARVPIAYLPAIEVTGAQDPVIQVVDEFDGEVVSTLRIRGTRWQPRVFREGTYTVRVRAGGIAKELTGVASIGAPGEAVSRVDFGAGSR